MIDAEKQLEQQMTNKSNKEAAMGKTRKYTRRELKYEEKEQKVNENFKRHYGQLAAGYQELNAPNIRNEIAAQNNLELY